MKMLAKAVAALLVPVALAGASSPARSQAAGLANPASVNCQKQGGTSRIERQPSGGEVGVCVFADDRQCEEWAMLRGDCPVGGLRVTGYVTPAARFCAITGGRYAVVAGSNTPDETGVCSLPGGGLLGRHVPAPLKSYDGDRV